jgi:hypothetical protein
MAPGPTVAVALARLAEAFAAEPDAGAPAGPAVPGVDPAAQASALADGMKAMRDDLRRNGAALATGTAAVLGAIGYTQLHEVFPAPAAGWFLPIFFAALTASVGGAVALTARIFAAGRRILIGTSVPRPGLSYFEDARVSRILREHAREEQAATIRDLDERALRLARIARRDHALADAASNESERLRAFIEIALKRAAAFVLEQRTRKALGGWLSVTALLLTAAGLTTVFVLADYSKSVRESAAPSKKVPAPAVQALRCARRVDARTDLTPHARTALENACARILTAQTAK